MNHRDRSNARLSLVRASDLDWVLHVGEGFDDRPYEAPLPPNLCIEHQSAHRRGLLTRFGINWWPQGALEQALLCGQHALQVPSFPAAC